MNRVRRTFWVIGGSISLLLGIIGIVIPLLPTTPLVILAGFCFGKSSPKLHHWIETNRYFGKYIQEYQKGNGVPLNIKLFAISIVWIGILSTLWIIPLILVKITMILIACGVTIFILTSRLLKEKEIDQQNI